MAAIRRTRMSADEFFRKQLSAATDRELGNAQVALSAELERRRKAYEQAELEHRMEVCTFRESIAVKRLG
jgi:hypothetical protein